MHEVADLLDRAIPDRTSTTELTAPHAAEVDFLAGRTAGWLELRPDVHVGVTARARALHGDGEGARCALAAAGEPWTPQGVAAATWAASRVGAGPARAALATAVADLADGFVFDDQLPVGTKALLAGLLAAEAGDLPCARDHLEAAVATGDTRAPMWGALARLELARVLRCHDAVAPDPASELSCRPGGLSDGARRALTSAGAFFAAGGYEHLRGRAGRLGGTPAVEDRAEPTLGHLRPGDRWQVGFGVQPWREVPERKGLRALHHLVANRHRRVPAVELEAVLDGRRFDLDVAVDLATDPDVSLEDADLPDALAKLLIDDRARSRTSKLLRRTIAALGDHHELAARHLAATVQTGYACRYEADARTVWRL